MSKRACIITWTCLYLLIALSAAAVFFSALLAVCVLITHLFGSNVILVLSLVLLVALLMPFAAAFAKNHCEKP